LFVFDTDNNLLPEGNLPSPAAFNVYQPRAWFVWGLTFESRNGYRLSMPRKLRVEYPGAMYHVMSRGDRREDIFLNDVDRQNLIKTLAEACKKTGWQVHAYCLMRNHYHVVLETPEANLVA
jgi:hypothetical protein